MKVRTRPLLVAAALLAGTVVPLTVPAAADTGPVPLGMAGSADVVVDESHGRVFVSGGPSGPGVKVTDLDGRLVTTLAFAGVTGLALSPDGSRLWMALPDFGLVSIDPATLVAQERWPISGCPGDVAVVGDRLVYGFSCNRYSPAGGGYGGIGVLDAATGKPHGTITSGPTYEPVVATGPAGLVYAASAALSPTSLYLYDVRGPAPALVASRAQACSNLRDLSASPDGSRVVTSCGSPYFHAAWSAQALESLPAYTASHYPLAGAFSADGRTFAGGTDSSYDTDVRVYTDGATTPSRTYDFGSGVLLQPRGLAVSADGSRAWAVTSTRSGPVELRVLGATPTPTPSTPTSPTSLSLAADPPEVTVGTATEVGGRLGSGGVTVGGAVLTVRRSATGAAPTVLPSVTTRSDGTFSFLDTPPTAGSWTYDVSWGGDSSRAGASAWTQVVARAVSLTATTLTASGPAATAVAGFPLTVSGRLAAAGSPVPGAAVRVERTGCGTAASATVTTSADGLWSSTDPAPPAGSCTWTASYAGSAVHAPSSAVASVAVVPRVTGLALDVVRGTGSTKKLAYVTARLTGGPALAVVTITAQPHGGNAVVLATGAVDASGTLRATYQPKTTTTYRVTYAGDAWHAPASAATTK